MKVKEQYIRWTGIPILGLIIQTVMGKHPDQSYIVGLLITIAFTALFWNGAVIILRVYRKRFPKIEQTPKRLISTILTLSIFLMLGGVPLKLIFGYVKLKEITSIAELFDYAEVNFIAAFVIGSIYESVYFFHQWRKAIQLNEALKHQQVRTQFEVLQNQMSPHFLFNSLNTLTTLIPENQEMAIEFTQKLSEVYRYILQNKEKELITLSEELDFARAYLFLLQIRFPENLSAHFSIDDKYQKLYIAPLTIQMLIENAIKHNIVSKSQPLSIDIYVENGKSIVVKNNLQVKKSIEKSTKTGLANIKKRYKYLGNREIDIITTTKNFMVAIPLIQLVKEKEYPLVAQV